MKILRLLAGLVLVFSTAVCPAADVPPKTITPPESLIVDGIPASPAELVEQVGRYTEARAAGVADWSEAERNVDPDALREHESVASADATGRWENPTHSFPEKRQFSVLRAGAVHSGLFAQLIRHPERSLGTPRKRDRARSY